MIGVLVDRCLDAVIDSGYLPQAIIRLGARRLIGQRLVQEGSQAKHGEQLSRKMVFFKELESLPIAVDTEAANEQQYEINAGVFECFMGPRMKYSCSLWETGATSLGEAEVAMLQTYVDKLGIVDGMKLLDLGCGWGSAVLYVAERFPRCEVVGFSNSSTQRTFIEKRASEKGLENIHVITGNVADYEFEYEYFDRILSVEMWEHMKNYDKLMTKVGRTLKPGGRLLVHHFGSTLTPYHYVADDGWMARYFFTGGTMMSSDLLLYFQNDLKVVNQWFISGVNYSQTCQAWLDNWTANKSRVWPYLVEAYGRGDASKWYYRWKTYHITCIEFFGYNEGEVYGVCHFLFEKPT